MIRIRKEEVERREPPLAKGVLKSGDKVDILAKGVLNSGSKVDILA
jgi:hypothetical protein